MFEMSNYAELIIENGRIADGLNKLLRVEVKEGVKVKTVELSKGLAEKIGKHEGKYVTVDDEGGNFENVLADALRDMSCGAKRILCVGIGNADMTTDALGKRTLDRMATSEKMMLFCPSVEAKTGIPSAKIMKSIVRTCKPDLMVAVDALSSCDYGRIGKSFQMTDGGISVGSALGEGSALNRESMGIRVIGIGVPTVVSAAGFLANYGCSANVPPSLLLTPKNIDTIVDSCAEKLARIISCAFL